MLVNVIAFFIIPLIWGRSLFLLGHKLLELITKKKTPESIWELPLWFILGALLIYGTSFAIGSQPDLFFNLIWIGAGILLIINLVFLPYKRLNQFLVHRKGWLVGLIILISSTLLFAIWTYRTPYSLNWDYHQHQLVARQISQGEIHFDIRQYSDTFGFNSYSTLFQTLVSVSQYGQDLSAQQVINYWQWAHGGQILFFAVVTFIFAWTLTKKKSIALVAAVVAPMFFDSMVSFTSLFLLPQTLAGIMTAALFCSIVNLLAKNKNKGWGWLAMLAIITYLILNHYVVGTFAALTLLIAFIYLKLPVFKTNKSRLMTLIILLVLILAAALVSYRFDLTTINQGESADYLYSLSEKYAYFQRVYGWAWVGFAAMGLGFYIWGIIKQKKITKLNFLVLLFIGGFIAIAFSNFPYVFKFLTWGRFFIDFLIYFGLYSLIALVSWQAIRYLLFGLTYLATLILFILNIINWKMYINYENIFAHNNWNEVLAAQFLKDNYQDQKALLFSDPATMHIMEGLSGVNTVGGNYMTATNRTHLADSYQVGTVREVFDNLNQIQDNLPKDQNPEKTLYAISGRTFSWLDATPEQQQAFTYNLWAPKKLNDYNWSYIKSLEVLPHFKEVYNDGYLVIFELHPEAAPLVEIQEPEIVHETVYVYPDGSPIPPEELERLLLENPSQNI